MRQTPKVAMIVTGFPTDENPSHGIFNKNAADLLSDVVDLTVIQLRVWKPGRKFAGEINNPKYIHSYLSAPYLPLISKKMISLPIEFYINRGNKNFSDLFESVDVFHSVGASFAGAIGSVWAKKFNKKHVLQVIGSDINSELPDLLDIKYFKDMPDNVDGASCNSLALKEKYLNLLSQPRFIEVIYRGIDLNKFQYNFQDFHDKKIKFLFLGGLPHYKYVDGGRNLKGGVTLMEAWKKLDASGVVDNCELAFAGPGSDSRIASEWKSSLKKPDNVQLTGKISPAEVTNLYTNFHVVIIPSLQEGLPNVALEAGATGKCVVASNIGGIPELITHNETGLLVEPGCTNSLSNSIAYLIQNPAAIKELGLKLSKRIEENFDNKKFVEGLLSMYKNILNQSIP